VFDEHWSGYQDAHRAEVQIDSQLSKVNNSAADSMNSGPATAASNCTLCFWFTCLTISIHCQKNNRPIIPFEVLSQLI
jgi:hypothetical protein